MLDYFWYELLVFFLGILFVKDAVSRKFEINASKTILGFFGIDTIK
jgi:hypothetical protein